MLKVIVAIFIFCFLFSKDINISLIKLYKKHSYFTICNRRWIYINKLANKREDLLSLVAYSCLKKGNLIPALDVAKFLKKTKYGRKNATYIANLFLMKKLIIQVIKDNLDVSSIELPIINDYIVGKIYSLLQTNDYKRDNNKLILKDKDFLYEISLTRKGNLLIKTFKNNHLIRKELIW